MQIVGYTLGVTIREDGEFVLRRGRRDSDGSRVLFLTPVRDRASAGSLGRLEHEMALRHDLDSAWAARPLDLVRQEGRTHLVLDDPGGEPLHGLLGRPMGARRFLRQAIAMVRALGSCHERGIVHKDVKPGHFLVDEKAPGAWLTGFGIASRLPRERPLAGPPEIIAGTLAYMAPEQTGRMNRSVDSRSDLYALGVTFYQMLTGRLPFTASDPVEWVHSHVARPAVPPSRVVRKVPERLGAIVMRLMAKTAEERYQTAAGVEADLARCLEEWEAQRRVPTFALGLHDVSDRLVIPQRLYGRDPAIRSLVGAFERVAAHGKPEIVLISGLPGIGKSSVVQELHRSIVRPRGIFISGKVDQVKRDIPYAIIAQAFQGLVRQILALAPREVVAWQASLVEALGCNGQLVVDVIPELELLMGKQAAVPCLAPREAQNRFQAVFRSFVGVLARQEHPLVVFVDDLQWLDEASLHLLEHLVTHPEVRYLFVVGACRSNEVGPSHPLMTTLDAIRQAGTPVGQMVLAPLSLGDVECLLADVLLCEPSRSAPLAALVHEKTAGNPFFAIQFLTSLREEHLLDFEPRAAAWRWDVERIRARGFTDNVVELMVGKLQRLPEATREALKHAACLGSAASAATLGRVLGRSEEEVHRDLWEAVHTGLVLRQESHYQFLHDRVREAAGLLIPEDERPGVHLRIGRLLLGGEAPEALAERVFDVVHQLSRAQDLVLEAGEREVLFRLNLAAGARAKSAVAYDAARHYLSEAAAMMSADAWETRHAERFELLRELAECEYLCGSFEAAEARFRDLHDRADTRLRKSSIDILRQRLYQVAGRYLDGVRVGIEGLRHFDVEIPEDEEALRRATTAEFERIPRLLGTREIADLQDAPLVSDPDVVAVISLLAETCPCAYIGKPEVMPLVTLKMLNLSLEHGNTPESCFAYSVYGLMAISLCGRVDEGFEYSQMSLRLNEKLGDSRRRGCLLHLHGDHIHFWKHPLATGFPYLEQGFQACLQVGDLVYASYLAFETVWQMVERGDVLDEILVHSEKFAEFCRQSSNEAVLLTIRLEQQWIAAWKGGTRSLSSLSDQSFDEREVLAKLEKATFGCGVVFYHVMKQILSFHCGLHAEALECAERARPFLGAAMAMPTEATYHFYHALTLLALYPQASPDRQQEFARILHGTLQKLELWAGSCAENFRGTATCWCWPNWPASSGGTWTPWACTRKRCAWPTTRASSISRDWRASWRHRSTRIGATRGWLSPSCATHGTATSAGGPAPGSGNWNWPIPPSRRGGRSVPTPVSGLRCSTSTWWRSSGPRSPCRGRSWPVLSSRRSCASSWSTREPIEACCSSREEASTQSRQRPGRSATASRCGSTALLPPLPISPTRCSTSCSGRERGFSSMMSPAPTCSPMIRTCRRQALAPSSACPW